MNTSEIPIGSLTNQAGLWCSLVSIPPLGGGGQRSESAQPHSNYFDKV
jgi:hypothetical protein